MAGGEEEERSLINRSEEARPTRCRVEPARVSSPQVDLTLCGLDKTPTQESLSSAVVRERPAPPKGRRYTHGTRAPSKAAGKLDRGQKVSADEVRPVHHTSTVGSYTYTVNRYVQKEV